MNVSVERAQGHQNAIYSIKICAKAKTELADISQNCFHEARIVLLQTELFSKIHLFDILNYFSMHCNENCLRKSTRLHIFG